MPLRIFGANEWRIEWCLRTGLTVAICSALALYLPSQHFLSNNGQYDIGPPFMAFSAIAVKDNTLGGTIANSWGFLFGSFISCFCCFIVQSLIGPLYNKAAAICLLLFFSFTLNYLEFHLLGKKLALSIFALSLLVHKPDPFSNWLLLLNVCVGVLVAIMSNIIPWPRIAHEEVEKKAIFCAEALSAVLTDVMSAWRYASIPVISASLPPKRSNSLLFGLVSIDNDKKCESKPVPVHRTWRLLRNILLAVAAFKMKKTDMNWSKRYSHHKNNKHMRAEIVQFLDEVLASMLVLVADARFGPARARAIVRDDHFCLLVRDTLLAISIFERRLRDIRSHHAHHPTLFAFQNLPNFRAAVDKFVKCVGISLSYAAQWLGETRIYPSHEAVRAIDNLRQARDNLDEAYIIARIHIYYNDNPDVNFQMTSAVAMNQNSFMFLFDALYFLHERYWTSFVNEEYRIKSEAEPDWLTHLVSMGYSIRKDLFPHQRHLFRFVNGQPTPGMILRCKQSLSLALSMVIAAIYGYFAERDQISLASFTIAYLTGGMVSGANAITSLNRATGTVAGSVYAVIIAYIVQNFTFVSGNIFIFFALVLFSFPCTYVRTLPIYGYSGTVAAFTAAVLLLLPKLNQQAAVDRIIDTYVGVVIFLFVDFAVAPAYSEDVLLSDINNVFKNIQLHFSDFIALFKTQSAVDQAKVKGTGFLADISHGKVVLMFSSAFPVPWRPPPLERRIMDDLINSAEGAHRSIVGMMWALVVCRRGSQEEEEDFAYLLRPLKDQLDKASAFVQMVSSYLQANTEHMRQWKLLQSNYSNCAVNVLINGDHSVVGSSNVLSNRIILLSTGDEEAEEVREFFSHIDLLIQNLQTAYKESALSYKHLGVLTGDVKEEEAEEGGERNKKIMSMIISNEEVKVVNSVLACTKDLVEALRAISIATTRLRASRDIRLTQNGARKKKN